jgi:hypothetical protein
LFVIDFFSLLWYNLLYSSFSKGGVAMGFFDKIKAMFGRDDEQISQSQVNSQDKRELCYKIIETARKITFKDSFNQTAARYANANVYRLESMDISELKNIYQGLTNSLDNAKKKIEEKSKEYDDDLQRAAWSGEKTKGMNGHDLDQYQQWGDR